MAKFLDFFAGIGGFRLGFELAGHECVGHVEWDKYAQQSYKAMYSHGKEDEYEKEYCGWDIRDTRANELPRADIWNFGAPCQDFSMAGKRAGLDGERSSLVHEVFRLVRETPEADRPRWLIYENVKGMLSSNGGRDFLAIITEMAALGYDVEWQLFNSKDYGVPQNRERIYTIGHLRGRSGGQILPITNPSGQACVPVKLIAHRKGYHRNLQTFSPDGITETLDTAQGGGRGHHVAVKMNRSEVKGATDTSHCLMARDYKGFGNRQFGTGVIERKVIPVLTPDRVDKRQNGRRFKEDGDPMFTLTTQDRHGVLMIDDQGRKSKKLIPKNYCPSLRAQGNSNLPKAVVFGGGKEIKSSGLYLNDSKAFHKKPLPEMSRCLKANKHDAGVLDHNSVRIRKLTPLECWRLQGFPDKYFYRAKIDGVSDSQLYKQAGNSVTVNVIYEIARRIPI